MKTSIKLTIMLLGICCVLLVAGAFPLAGAPAIYRGGLMQLLSYALALLALWGAWRLSAGARLRLLGGMVCLFFTCAGGAAAWFFAKLGFQFPGKDAAEAMAASTFATLVGSAGLYALGLVGVLFVAIFGFLTLRLTSRRLWLAALHAWVFLLLLGAHIDFHTGFTLTHTLTSPAMGEQSDAGMTVYDAQKNKVFSLSVKDFEVLRYEGAESYTLLRHEGGHWQPLGTPERRGEELVLGEEHWSVAELKSAPDSAQRFLLLPGIPPRLLLENPPPVKDYRATCILSVPKPEGEEKHELLLRVNEPIYCEGYIVYLMNYIPGTYKDTPTMVEVQLRQAPGRKLSLFSILGIIICTAGWAFSPASREKK